jgi:hypothetical protein
MLGAPNEILFGQESRHFLRKRGRHELVDGNAFLLGELANAIVE